MDTDNLHDGKNSPKSISVNRFSFCNENKVDNGLNRTEYYKLAFQKHADYRNAINFSYSLHTNLSNIKIRDNEFIQSKQSLESIYNDQCEVDLKSSTRKLLYLLHKILSDTNSKLNDGNPKYNLRPIKCHEDETNCSAYNRLTRKCQCLNRSSYNDFMIMFNENTKHSTCEIGEILKNMRILKKFIYMGNGYTKNALKFLKEALSECSLTKKADLIKGCAHADICNIFEEHSIVTTFIYYPYKYSRYGDPITQMSANLIYKIANTEEGRRYLNYNSKIIDDITRSLKKSSSKFNLETIELLNATLNLLQEHFVRHVNIAFYCKPDIKGNKLFFNERAQGIGTRTLMDLIKRRNQMTLEEVLINLELLKNLSKFEQGKRELNPYLSVLLNLLKQMLKEYDNSNINIKATDLLNNVIFKNTFDHNIFR